MFLSKIDLVGYLYVNNNFMQTFSCSMPEALDVVCVYGTAVVCVGVASSVWVFFCYK